MNDSEKQKIFMELLGPLSDGLNRFAMSMTRNRDEAKDLVSETVLAVYENFEKIRDHNAFKSYVFTTASRLHKRSRWRLRIFDKFDDSKAELMPDPGAQPDTSAEVRFLYEAMAKLPEKMREALVLFEISGLSLEDIRELQGGSLSGVKARLKRGREKLAAIMNDSGNDHKITDKTGNKKVSAKHNAVQITE